MMSPPTTLNTIATCGVRYSGWVRDREEDDDPAGRERRTNFNPLLHFLFPILGATAFAFPLYYQFKDWPDNPPLGYGNWIAIGWIGAGLIVTVFMARTRWRETVRCRRRRKPSNPAP
jgi:hypothetical protein